MSLYQALHANPQGPGDSRPTALQIIQDENLEGELAGKVIVITGATSGIGAETARALYATGATLFIAGRDIEKARCNLSEITGSGRVTLLQLDNSSLSSVNDTASKILADSHEKVNILINNAGVMGIADLEYSIDGHEKHLATNHLGHFLLFQRLQPCMLASSTPDFPSRVVNLTSSSHRVVKQLNSSNNYNFQDGEYSWLQAYANSKLANIYMANALERRYGSQGIHAISVNPGEVVTNILRYLGGQVVVDQILANAEYSKTFKTPAQGAATVVLAAVGKEWKNKGGVYLENCAEAQRGKEDGEIVSLGYVGCTFNYQDEERLWEDSLKMVC